MANDAAPVRTELLGEHDSESPILDVPSRKRDVDCFGPAIGEAPFTYGTYVYSYHNKITDVFVHPSLFDDGEGNF